MFDDEDASNPSEALSSLPIHAVIHKRTDDMAAAVAARDTSAAKRILALDRILAQYFASDPRVVIINPMEGIWRLVDRRKISEAVDRVFGPPDLPNCQHVPYRHRKDMSFAGNIKTAAWTQVPVRKGSLAVERAIQDKLSFPIILKRRVACGTKASHEMVIAYDMDGALAAIKAVFGGSDQPLSIDSHDYPIPGCAEDFAAEIIAQQFITYHGGVLFKVYSIGSNVAVQPRPSVNHSIKAPHCGYYYFDSHSLKRGDHFAFDPNTGCSKLTEAIMPSPKLTKSIIAELSKELGLSLLGVDLVYDIHSKYYYIVDINYFPGYKGVAKPYESLLQHICNQVWEQLEEQ